MEKEVIFFHYKRKHKWLGIIDYQSLVLLCIYTFLIISLIRVLPISLEYSFYLFLFLVIPVAALLFVHADSDSAVDILMIIFHFLCKRKIFVRKEYLKKLDKKLYVKIESLESKKKKSSKLGCKNKFKML